MGNVYMPIIHSPTAFLPARMGAQIEGQAIGLAQWFVPGRLYQWPLKWRDYPSALYDENHSTLQDYPQIITNKVVPQVYRLWPDFVGSPPRADCYPELVDFIQDVVDSYHPAAVELFNEPDTIVGTTAPECFGAWVGAGETMRKGGARYGAMCKYVMDHVRGTKLLAGALFMHEGSGEFLQEAIDAGLQAHGVSFHCYITQREQFGRMESIVKELREITSLPLVCTETSLLDDEPGELQADYMEYLKRHFGFIGVEAFNWYTLGNNGWRHSDLIATTPRPAYGIWATS